MPLTRKRSRRFFLLLFAFAGCCCITNAQPKTGLSALFDQCITQAIQNPYHTLAEEVLATLTEKEIDLFQNFIFARRFTTQRNALLGRYFVASDKTLTAAIKQDSNFIRSTVYNLALLDAFQHKDAVMVNSPQFNSSLDGYWQQGTAVIAATLLTNYHFLQQDHSFLYEHKSADKKDRLISFSGFYTFTSTGIELEIRTKTLYKTAGINRAKTGDLINPGTQTVLHLEDAYEYQTISLSPIYTIRFDGIEKSYCRIKGKIFWKCYPAE